MRSKRHDYILVNIDCELNFKKKKYNWNPELSRPNLWKIHWDEQSKDTGKKHDGYAIETIDDQIPESELIRYDGSVEDYLQEHGLATEMVDGYIITYWRNK